MLHNKVLILTSLNAAQACCTAMRNCTAVFGLLSMPRIWPTIWCQMHSIGLLFGLLDSKSMTSTSRFSRKSIVAQAVCEGALSGPSQSCSGRWLLLSVRDLVAARLYTSWFMVSSSKTWREPNHDTISPEARFVWTSKNPDQKVVSTNRIRVNLKPTFTEANIMNYRVLWF